MEQTGLKACPFCIGERRMKKVFVSMPMRDKERSEIVPAQKKALSALNAYLGKPLMLIETFIDDKASPLECLGESIKRMSNADYVLFSEGWENSRGCRVEYECAKEYGLKIFFENEGNITEAF